jgi:hypothetical protein
MTMDYEELVAYIYCHDECKIGTRYRVYGNIGTIPSKADIEKDSKLFGGFVL